MTKCTRNQAIAKSSTESSSASAMSARLAPATATGSETDASHRRSVRNSAAQRPAERTSARTTRVRATRRPRPGIGLGANALGREPARHLRAVALERSRTGGLEAQDEHGLGVGGPEEAPAVGKGDPHAVDLVDGVAGGEVGRRALHHAELLLVGAIHPHLRRGEGGGEVREETLEPGRARAHDFRKAGGGGGGGGGGGTGAPRATWGGPPP